jgi:hypothetical protein
MMAPARAQTGTFTFGFSLTESSTGPIFVECVFLV